MDAPPFLLSPLLLDTWRQNLAASDKTPAHSDADDELSLVTVEIVGAGGPPTSVGLSNYPPFSE